MDSLKPLAEVFPAYGSDVSMPLRVDNDFVPLFYDELPESPLHGDGTVIVRKGYAEGVLAVEDRNGFFADLARSSKQCWLGYIVLFVYYNRCDLHEQMSVDTIPDLARHLQEATYIR